MPRPENGLISVDELVTELELALMAIQDGSSMALTVDDLNLRPGGPGYSEPELSNLISALLEYFPEWDGQIEHVSDEIVLLDTSSDGTGLYAQRDVNDEVVFVIELV